MEKIKIAVCDDEQGDLEHVLGLIHDYDTEGFHQIVAYTNAKEFLEDSEKFDIVLLDIEMPPPNGFDVARDLAAKQKHPIIIFTTKSNAYAIKGYGIALRYLQKPLAKNELFQALDLAIEETTAHRITFVINDARHMIRLCEVKYIEIVGHYLNIYTIDKQYRVRNSLKELIRTLPKGYFAYPHNSFVVNLEYVKTVTRNEVILDNGVIVPISRRKSADFNSALFRFIGR